MPVAKYLKYFLVILFLPFALLALLYLVPVIFLVLSLIIPSKPQPINEVFSGACSSELPKNYAIKSREHSYSPAPHGVWYQETTYIQTNPAEALKIFKNLESNQEFILEENHFKKFTAGKILATCSVNVKGGNILYGYTLW